MNDRELLSLAAKAAGHQVYIWGESGKENCSRIDVDPAVKWNPLTDDGDALRLAVALRLDIYNYEDGPEVMSEQSCITVSPDEYGCLLAALRRAIVRAAAIIGESMQ